MTSSETTTTTAAATTTSSTTCHICQLPPTISCDRCLAQFCSEEHLRILHDRTTDECYPVRMLYSDEVGNYLVATRDLNPLEIILKDWAFPSGPRHDRTPVCLSCFIKISPASYVSCRGCLLPMCSESCSQNAIHVDQECRLFRELDLKVPPDDERFNNIYKNIFIVRMLLLSESNPLEWSRINMLMDHKEERLKDQATWTMFQRETVDYIRHDLGMADRFDEDLIHRCIGLGTINAVQASEENASKYRCLFPTMALFSSYCTPNAKCLHIDDPITLEKGITVLAQTHIPAGEEISIQYNRDYHMTGTRRRRKMYHDIWFFDCRCRRCRDPTENGSYLNGLICPKCRNGIVLAADPLDFKSHWLCDSCNHRLEEDEVDSIEKIAEQDITNTMEMSDKTDGNLSYVERCENLLIHLSNIFHAHHYLVMRVKSQLISQYGNVPGYLYDNLSIEKVRRKIDLCREFIDVFGLVDPGGSSDWWAATTYESVLAEIVLIQRAIESGSISIDSFREAAKLSEKKLTQVVKILEAESEGTYLHNLSKKAKKDIASVQELIRFADFL